MEKLAYLLLLGAVVATIFGLLGVALTQQQRQQGQGLPLWVRSLLFAGPLMLAGFVMMMAVSALLFRNR